MTTASAPARYEFDDAFQQKIAALLMRDVGFHERAGALIKPQYFANVIDGAIVSQVQGYYEHYRRLPDLVVLVNLVKGLFRDKVLREDLKDETAARIKALVRADISDGHYVADQVASFAMHQALEAAILKSVEFLEKRQFTNIEAAIKEALLVGVAQDTAGYDYFGEIESRTAYRKAVVSGAIKPTGITTGVKALDDELEHRGWGRSELSSLLGGAKSGKTMGLADFAKNASLAGHNVIYFSFEVSKKILSNRLDSNLSDFATKWLNDHIMAVDAKLRDVAKRAGKLYIHEAPSGTFRPADMRRVLAAYKAKGIKFDLQVTDYADIMAPDRWVNDAIENSKSIWLALRAIAQEEDAAGLTATQSNREGSKTSVGVTKAEHVAEDFNKVRIADLMIAINRSDADIKEDKARISFAASRNTPIGFTMVIKQDLSKAQFLKEVIERL